MGTYYKLNNQNKIENTILAEKDFIESQPDKEKYIRLITNSEEEYNSKYDFSYALNKPLFKHIFNEETKQIVEVIQPIYNYEKRKFKNPQFYNSWTWNEELYEWEPPIPEPPLFVNVWDEEHQKWVKMLK
jgi:hypothetical protein